MYKIELFIHIFAADNYDQWKGFRRKMYHINKIMEESRVEIPV